MPTTDGKANHLIALADSRGIIAAAAMDQRGSLLKAIANARGVEVRAVDAQAMSEFKTAVSRVLTPHASAILLDPEYGLPAVEARGRNCGLLLAYELSGYDNTRPGRLPDLLGNVSVRRIRNWGANAVKVLTYYSPFEDAGINDRKHAFLERIGAECAAEDIPFFLEFVGYDPAGGDEKGLEFARLKPQIVMKSMEEFSKPQYRVDVLKVEVPVNLKFIGTAYSRAEALRHFKEASDAATKPFIYLSAGVDNEAFVEQLRMAAEAGSRFSGVLCGRATWKEGIPVYARHGVRALEDWLSNEGVKNIRKVNEAIQGATPYYSVA